MMWKTNRYAYASALPAIAAALALSSTPAWSQEVTPSTTALDPVTMAPPAPTETAPATTTVTDPTPTVDTTETTATSTAKPKAKPATAKAARTVATKKPATTRVASTATPAAAAPASTPVAEAAPATPRPIVDARPQEDAQPATESSQPILKVDETTMMLGGGAIALLALGGAGLAMAGRRRRKRQELADEAAMDQPMTIEPEPETAVAPRHDVIHEEQPAIVVPSAFAWGNEQPAERHVEGDRRPGETWVERAERGPTPDNPSLSLRKRLKRAAFFDAREKRVEAGKAEPVDADAGLPENAISERELELA